MDDRDSGVLQEGAKEENYCKRCMYMYIVPLSMQIGMHTCI